MPTVLSAAKDATADGGETTWAHWLSTAPDLVYDATARSHSPAKDVKGIVSSGLRSLLRSKASKQDALSKENATKEQNAIGEQHAEPDPLHSFVRLRPTLDHSHLAPTQLVEALGGETIGEIHTHWDDVSSGGTGNRWRAHPVHNENAIEARYLAAYVRLMSALADTAAMQTLGTASLCLVSQQAVKYRHYDGTLHTALVDVVNVGADGMDGKLSGPPHEFKHDSVFTPEHIAALDAVHELSIVAVEHGGEPTQPLPTTILASPAERDRDKVDFFFSTATGTLGERVSAKLSTALTHLLQAPFYAGAGHTRRGSIGAAKRWIATQNEYDTEPFVAWARSIGDPSGLPSEDQVEKGGEVEEEVNPISFPWDDLHNGLPTISQSPVSHFAFLAGSTYSHLTGDVVPHPEWPRAHEVVETTPRNDRRKKLGLRPVGSG